MKYLVIFFLLLGTGAYSQVTSARIDTIEAIIINKYSRNNLFGTYCEMPSILFNKNGDSILFFQRAWTNITLLQKNPQIESLIGNSDNFKYDYFEDYFSGTFKNDLTISIYNLHTEEFHKKVVKSPAFYDKDGSDDLYSIYQFKGLIVFYEGYNYYTPENFDECFCPIKDINHNSFAVLKEAWELKPLTDKQRLNMALKKSGIISIEVFYCE